VAQLITRSSAKLTKASPAKLTTEEGCMGYAEIIMFAIQAALQLYGAGRRAYVDGTRGRTLILPLPRMDGVQLDSARAWFTLEAQGIALAARMPQLARLLASDAPDDHATVLDLYLALRAEVNPSWDPGVSVRGQFNAEQLSALLEVHQWAAGEAGAPPSALQQVGGTLINIAVDYFADTPGAVSPKRPAGRALLAFLQAIEKVDFATVPLTEIVPDLMVAMLDAVADNPALAGGGEKEQQLVKSVASSMAQSAKKYLADATTEELKDARAWLGLATRALVKGGADAVLANPVLFLGIKAGAESNVVTQVGSTITDLLVGDEQLTFRRLLSGEGLSAVVRSSLDAVAKNPELLKVGNQGLKNVLVAIAGDVAATEGVLGPDLFPELARLVLQHSADNIDLLWGKSFNTADRHLLVTASGQLLAALATPAPAGAKWTPRLTRDQILKVAGTVFDEVIDNPDWLLQRAGAVAPPLRVALDAMLSSLRSLDGSRISADAGVAMLQAGIKAVALQLPLLNALPAAGGDAGKTALGAALDAVFAELFRGGDGSAAQWRVARSSLLSGAVEIGLTELAKAGAKPEQIAALRAAARALADGTTLDLDHFASDLQRRLAA
jgi:hypothetical protein